jgi:sigma-B regulation protein RsbQ
MVSNITDSFTAPEQVAIIKRFNVNVIGAGKPTLLFCNGFNCNQYIWNYLTPALTARHQLVLFDQMGTGDSDLNCYNPAKYASLAGYAQDVVDICQALELREVVIIGHSVGAMIAMLAAIQAPQYFVKAVLVAATPCYLNEPGYYGGFERADMLDLLAEMQGNYESWANTFATLLIGQDQPASLGYELAGYFCQADPTIAREFAHMSFLADNRADVPQMPLPTLLLQCSDDVAVPAEVGDYLLAHLPQGQLITLRATGHCPHLSAPMEVLAAMRDFIS